MIYKKSLIFACFFIFLFSFASVCASDVNNHVIVSEDNLQLELPVSNDQTNQANDTEIIAETDDGTFTALQNKIDGADIGSTIVLENNYNYNDGFTQEGININKQLTIDGNGFTIDGGGSSRIFNVLADGVVFNNIVFQNGHAEGNGGAINGNCIITGCTFNKNYANGDGGAVYNANAEGCTFSGNSAEYRGGGIYNGNATGCTFKDNNYAKQAGGGIHTGDALNCIFTANGAADQGAAMYGGNAVGCSFENNYADNHGAGISNGNAVNCTFTGNHVNHNGGAIYKGSATGCNFTGNYAWYGGAIYSEEEEQPIEDCNFTGNWAYNGGAVYGNNMQYSILNSYFQENGALTGGGIYNGIATYCIFVKNAAREADNDDDGDGGAMYGGAAYFCTFDTNYAHDDGDGAALSHSYAENCTFKLNHAADLGGAIYYTDAVNCTFSENSASNAGGAMYQGTATNCIFEKNSLDGGGEKGGAIYQANAKNCIFIGNSAYHGGAMNGEDGDYTAEGCTFIGNSADGGGAIYDVTAVNCLFTNNTSTDDGGAMYYKTATNCTFITNHADSDGGAFYKATTYNCTFVNNTPKVDTFRDLQDLINDAGDTLHLDYDYYFDESIDDDYTEGVEIDDDITIEGNGRTIDGRRMARIFKIKDGNSVTINNLNLINGMIKTPDYYDVIDGGGAIFIDKDATLTTNNVNFYNNTANHFGGAIFIFHPNLNINGGKFIDNKVISDGDFFAFGGAIFCDGVGDSIFNNTSFIHNEATVNGGALYLSSGSIKIDGCEFIDNIAFGGGAIRGASFAEWEYKEKTTSISIMGNTKFISNIATGTDYTYESGGGAINLDSYYNLVIDGGEFINNYGGSTGGAVKSVLKTHLNIIGVKFINNSAITGGAVYFDASHNLINNSIFINNSASDGGAVYIVSYDNLISNSIFINNSASRGNALFVDNELALENNTINTEYPEIYVDDKGYITSPVYVRIMDNTTYEFLNPVNFNASLLSDDRGNLIYDEGIYFLAGDIQVSAHYDEEKMIYYSDNVTLDEGNEYLITVASDNEQIIAQTSVVKMVVVPKGSFTELLILIREAERDNNTLDLPYDFTYDKDFDSEYIKDGILINNTFHIDGGGHTIDGSGLSGIFRFSKSAILSNINFVNANSSGKMGGAIYMDNRIAYALIDNCNFTNNTALSGGAVYSNSELIINYSNFENNFADANGSAIYARNHFILDNSVFTDNLCCENGTLFLSGVSVIENSNFINSGNTGKNYTIVNLGNLTLNINNISSSVLNMYQLFVHENNIGGTIYNYGEMNRVGFSAVVIDGETVNVNFGETIHPYATLINHDGNAIFEPDFCITIDGESINTGYDGENRRYVANYTPDIVCERIVSTNYPALSVVSGKYVVQANLSKFIVTVMGPSKNIVYGRNVTLSVIIMDDKGNKLNVEDLPVIVNNKKYHLKIVNGTQSFIVSDLKPGNYSAVGVYEWGDYEFYATEVFSVYDPSVLKYNTTISSDVDVDVNCVTIAVSVNSTATGFVEFKINDKFYYYPVIKGQAVFVSNFSVGNYSGYAEYLGDDKFNGNSTPLSFNVSDNKRNTTIDLNVSSVENNVTFTVNVDKNATGFVKLEVSGSEEYTLYLEVVDGKAVHSDVLNKGDYEVVVTYIGDSQFNSNTVNETFTVTGHVKKNTTIEVVAKVNGYQVTIEVSVNKSATGFVRLTVLGTVFNIELINGTGSITSTLPASSYSAGVKYLGDENFNENSTRAVFTVVDVSKKNTTIDLNVSSIDNNVTFTVDVDKNATGLVKFEVSGPEEYTLYLDVVDGRAVLEDILNKGDYEVVVTYMGDGQFNSNVTHEKFTVKDYVKKDTYIILNITNVQNNATFTVDVDKNATGLVKLELTGPEEYTLYVDIVDGKAIFKDVLINGKYNITTTYMGSDEFNVNATSVVFDVDYGLIIAGDMRRGWNSGVDYQLKVVDSWNKAIAGKNVSFTIGSKLYYALSDSNGIAAISPNLDVGNYKIIITDPFTGENITHNIDIIARIVENVNINAYYNDGKIFKARIIGDDGNPVSSGAVFKITVNGKQYTYKTDSAGYIKIKFDQKYPAGKYTINLSYKGYSVKNIVNIKHAIVSKKVVSVKKSAKKLVLKATLKGNNVKNKKVTFKFNGKTYSAKTNSKGIVKVKISKNVISRLKVGKNVPVKIIYLKDKIKTYVKARK